MSSMSIRYSSYIINWEQQLNSYNDYSLFVSVFARELYSAYDKVKGDKTQPVIVSK